MRGIPKRRIVRSHFIWQTHHERSRWNAHEVHADRILHLLWFALYERARRAGVRLCFAGLIRKPAPKKERKHGATGHKR